MLIKPFDQLTIEQIAEISDYMMPESIIEPADVALLFGTRHGLPEFYKRTLELYKAGFYKTLIISGGRTGDWKDSEASVIRKGLIEQGHPEDAIILEEYATNTGQNVQFSMDVIDAHLGISNVRSVIAIGKISSTRRYLMTLEKFWPAAKKYAAPINYFNTPREEWHEDTEFRKRIMGELNKIPEYINQGFIKELDTQNFRPFPSSLFI